MSEEITEHHECRRRNCGRRAVDHERQECEQDEVIREMSDFLQAWKLRERRKSEMWEAIKTQVLGWGIVAIIGTVGTWVASNILHVPTASN